MNLHRIEKDQYQVVLNTPIDLEQADVDNVAAFLTKNYRGKFFLSETRGAIIPCHTKVRYNGIKIKGAGYRGKGIQFGKSSGFMYSFVHYGFEGNPSHDIAKDYDKAYLGGMTYQQALHEFCVSSYLIERNFDTLPPLGYGVVKYEGLRSWFCLLNVPFEAPAGVEVFENPKELAIFCAQTQIQLRHTGVYMVLNGFTKIQNRLIRKDFHTSVIASPNDSFMTRLCYYLVETNRVAKWLLNELWTKSKKEREPACIEYMSNLTGVETSMEEVRGFFQAWDSIKKPALIDIYQKIKLMRNNKLIDKMLMDFMSESEKIQFLDGKRLSFIPSFLHVSKQMLTRINRELLVTRRK